jgi:hypothetical protein
MGGKEQRLPVIELDVQNKLDRIASEWARLLSPGAVLKDQYKRLDTSETFLRIDLTTMMGPTGQAQALIIGPLMSRLSSILVFDHHVSSKLLHPVIESKPRFDEPYEWIYIHALFTHPQLRGEGLGSISLSLLDKIISQRAKNENKLILAFGVDQSGSSWSEVKLSQLGFANARRLPTRLLRMLHLQTRFYKEYKASD